MVWLEGLVRELQGFEGGSANFLKVSDDCSVYLGSVLLFHNLSTFDFVFLSEQAQFDRESYVSI